MACGPSNIRSSHQKDMSSSSRQNSKETWLWISRTSITSSRCVSIRWLDWDKTSFLVTSPSKDTLSLKNTSSQIAITLPITGIFRYTLPLNTHSYWQWLMTLVQNPPWHLNPTKLSALMLMRSQDGPYSQDLSIHVPFTLDEWIVMFNLIYSPWPSIM